MPFLQKNQLPDKFKNTMNNELRDRLRKALADPALTPEQRDQVKKMLENIGKAKVYDPESLPKNGSIVFNK